MQQYNAHVAANLAVIARRLEFLSKQANAAATWGEVRAALKVAGEAPENAIITDAITAAVNRAYESADISAHAVA